MKKNYIKTLVFYAALIIGVLLVVSFMFNSEEKEVITYSDIVEYFTSFAMEKLFDKKWWDYSKKKFNLNGRICLEHSCYWGIFSVALIYLIHQYGAEKLASIMSYNTKLWIFTAVLTVFFVDLIITVRITQKKKAKAKK